jgi:hypothetical protein
MAKRALGLFPSALAEKTKPGGILFLRASVPYQPYSVVELVICSNRNRARMCVATN